MRMTIRLLCLLLAFTSIANADDNLLCPTPIFADCPDTLTANCGDTIRYQFQLLDQRTGQPRPDARYFVAKGYGDIDSLTGLYIYPDHGLINHVRPAKIGAYFATSKQPDTAYCTFTLKSCLRQPPQILGECPRIATSFSAWRSTMIEFEWESQCGESQWTVIPPEDSGVSATMLPPGVLTLAGNAPGNYTALVILTDNCGDDTCEVQFTITDRYPYDVRIAKKRMVLQGGYENVTVSIDSVFPGMGLGGFDLLITFDHTAISLQTVTEGDIYEKCGWEYFTYRYGADSNCPTCPPGLIRVIGIAETNNGDDHPFCKYPEALPATLFTMKFLVSNDRSLVCQYVPIRFFWRDCDDNRLMCDSGYCDYFMAGRVFDSLGAHSPIDPSTALFPGTNGLPYDSCRYISNLFPAPQRYADFYHGGLEIAGPCPFDERGDLNLNDFAYELVDIDLFARYFMYGEVVFAINAPAQIHMSDVNYDDIPLTVEDFCYMYRIIAGAEIARDQLPPLDTATFELSQGALTLTSTDTLGALLLTVAGEVTPTLHVDRVGMQYYFDGSVTRIFVSPILDYSVISDSAYILPSTILTGLEGHDILSIRTAEYRGGKLFASIEPPRVAPYAIRISKDYFVMQGTYAEIDVTLERTDQLLGLGGYNLLLSYNSRHLAVSEILPGSIYDSCAWEYFNFRLGVDGNCSAGCPTGALRVFGIAETNNGTPHAVTDCPIDGLTLFSVKFLVSNEMNLNCAFLPVRPFWLDCGDNTLSDKTGDILLIAHDVYRYCDDLPFSPEDAVFPGIAGVPEGYCPILPSHIPRRRWIDFYPGGVEVACADSADGRGDVDINGDPFEIADELLFARYLVYGDPVLTVSKLGQLVTTDINSDGELGTIEDYVLLHRQVHGLGNSCWADDLAFADMPPGRANFTLSNKTLFVETNDTLGAVLLTVAGYAWPRQIAPNMKVRLYFDHTVTRVLIAPDIENPAPDDYILSGPIVDGIDPGHILSIEAASWRGGKITPHIVDTLPEIALSIGKVEAIYQGPTVTVPVKLQRLADHISLAGFDLLITFEDSALIFESVIPGSLYELAGWEYFNWRLDNPALCQADCPGGLLRVIGLADMNNGITPSGSSPRGVVQTLFNITFRIGDLRLYECLDIPVSFYWTNCDDNQCVVHPDLPLRPRHVYSHRFPFLTATHYPVDSAVFPGIKGTPLGACGYSGFNGIDFFHGNVHIPCEPELDPIGDLNLNGLSYEIADESLFAAYFLHGLSAFTINQAGQVEASDINRDSTTLTVEDYVLMHRIINGWALPYDNPPTSPDTVVIWQRKGEVVAETEDTLGAIVLVVVGNVTPSPVLSNMVTEFAFDGTYTHIFIHPPHGSTDSTAYILSGTFVQFSSLVPILSISTSTHRGSKIASLWDIMSDAGDNDNPNLPSSFALHQNYPNPFNAGTVISFDLPRASEVRLEIINVLGNVVYRHSGDFSAGTHRIHWQGTTTASKPVASGIYYYRLTTASFTATKKMLLLK